MGGMERDQISDIRPPRNQISDIRPQKNHISDITPPKNLKNIRYPGTPVPLYIYILLPQLLLLPQCHTIIPALPLYIYILLPQCHTIIPALPLYMYILLP